MIINHLSIIQDLYKKHGETLFFTSEFSDYLEQTIQNKSLSELLLCIAYETKDYGDSIEKNAVTDNVQKLFESSENTILVNSSFESIFNYYMAAGIFNKHFVFNNRNDYLKFYLSCVDKSYTSESILNIFNNSFSNLRNSFINFEKAIAGAKNVSVIQNSFLAKESLESYSLLEALSDPDSYPNIDSSYVYLDQINNSDFFSTASSLLFQWCVKNAKRS
jgi:hypothetical protein